MVFKTCGIRFKQHNCLYGGYNHANVENVIPVFGLENICLETKDFIFNYFLIHNLIEFSLIRNFCRYYK